MDHSKSIDGIRYNIVVGRLPGGFAGIWECETCREQGILANLMADAAEAVKAVDAAIREHHAAHHIFSDSLN
jgi:hypothetical protein